MNFNSKGYLTELGVLARDNPEVEVNNWINQTTNGKIAKIVGQQKKSSFMNIFKFKVISMYVVNSLLFILRDVWYTQLHNDRAVLMLVIKCYSCQAQTYNYSQRQIKTYNQTFVYSSGPQTSVVRRPLKITLVLQILICKGIGTTT